jgi:phosphonate transport system ATP-binding protein
VVEVNGPAPLLSLKHVSAAPPEANRPVLSDVTIEVQRGERVALVGPSGAGKTTLLRTINGQIPATAGEVTFEGVDLGTLGPTALRQTRARIGLITQKHDLVEMLRVDKNVMAGALGRWSTARALRFLFWARTDELAEAESALAAVGIAHKLRSRTAALSGGEQQRVAIARALVQAPALLLADEPVASLDPATAHEILELLVGISRKRGMALICSLHQPDLAARFFDRILEVRGGRVLEYSPSSLAPAIQRA